MPPNTTDIIVGSRKATAVIFKQHRWAIQTIHVSGWCYKHVQFTSFKKVNKLDIRIGTYNSIDTPRKPFGSIVDQITTLPVKHLDIGIFPSSGSGRLGHTTSPDNILSSIA